MITVAHLMNELAEYYESVMNEDSLQAEGFPSALLSFTLGKHVDCQYVAFSFQGAEEGEIQLQTVEGKNQDGSISVYTIPIDTFFGELLNSYNFDSMLDYGNSRLRITTPEGVEVEPYGIETLSYKDSTRPIWINIELRVSTSDSIH